MWGGHFVQYMDDDDDFFDAAAEDAAHDAIDANDTDVDDAARDAYEG
jgi:hypothetical protein